MKLLSTYAHALFTALAVLALYGSQLFFVVACSGGSDLDLFEQTSPHECTNATGGAGGAAVNSSSSMASSNSSTTASSSSGEPDAGNPCDCAGIQDEVMCGADHLGNCYDFVCWYYCNDPISGTSLGSFPTCPNPCTPKGWKTWDPVPNP